MKAFWKFHGGVYSVLQSIARDFLAVQATSAFSEREFSKAKKIFVPERNRLGSFVANATLCLKSWYNITAIRSALNPKTVECAD